MNRILRIGWLVGISVWGFAAGGGRDARALPGADVVTAVALQRPYAPTLPTIYVDSRMFTASSPEVAEGCATVGTHKLLHFDFATRNVGDGDFIIGAVPAPLCTGGIGACFDSLGNACNKAGTQNGFFVWSDAHCHWHTQDFNNFALYRSDNTRVNTGVKQAFCVEDWWGWSGAGLRYECSQGNQEGISVGVEDIYEAGLSCQWLIVDNVPDGTYRLVATTNVQHRFFEERYANNTTSYTLTLSGSTVTTGSPGVFSPVSTSSLPAGATVAAASWGPNHDDIFWVGSNNQLVRVARDNGSNSQSSVPLIPGTTAATAPALISIAPSELEVLTRGADSKLWFNRFSGGGWGSWTAISSTANVAHRPTAVALPATNATSAFWVASDGTLWEVDGLNGSWVPGTTQQISAAGLAFKGVPSVVGFRSNQWDIFVRSTGNAVYHDDISNVPVNWQAIPSATGATSDPIAVSPDISTIYVFYQTSAGVRYVVGTRNTVNGLVRTYTAPALVPTTGGPASITSIAAIANGHVQLPSAIGNQLLYVFARAADNGIWMAALNGSSRTWSQIAPAGTAGGPLAGVTWADQHFDVFYANSSNKLGRITLF